MKIATFQILEGGLAILSIGGRYGQFPLYRRGTEVFAEVKGAFIRLSACGGTSVPNTRWHDVESGNLDQGLVLTNKLGIPEWFVSPDAARGKLAA